MKGFIFSALVYAPLIASSSELLACKPVYLVQRETKSGYSVGLANIPAKELPKGYESPYLLDGKRVDKDTAVAWATSNLKPVLKEKKN